jgi:hypothetical protein
MRSKLNTQEFIERVGYYKVHGSEVRYDNKWDTMLLASVANSNYSWEFAPEVFSKIDWSVPIQSSLDELYRMRLQQLRDEYDHLTLFFSGGKDSLNILMTSIKNNILIDEIVVYYPFVMESKFNNQDVGSDNLYSETKYAAKAILKEYEHQIDKRTKIRFQDNGELNAKFLENKDWFDEVRPANTLQLVSPTYASATDPHFLDLAMQGKHSAIITGADKPMISESNGGFYFTFMDAGFNSITRPRSEEMKSLFNSNVNFEAFYHTPFLPELVVKQAQVAAAAYNTDARLRNLIVNPNDPNMMYVISEKEKILAQYLYSDGLTPWQTLKHRKDLVRGGERAVWQTLSDAVKENYTTTLKDLVSRVHPRFFAKSNYVYGPAPCFSRSYFIQPATYKEN